MILQFPDADVLVLALTSGTIPPEIAAASASFRADEDGTLVIHVPAPLPTAAIDELRRLGVRVRAGRAATDTFLPIRCWLQAVPVETVPAGTLAIGERTPVLFELRDDALLPELVDEMLRLGNDRQSFRRVAQDPQESEVVNAGRTLLRVIGPPYYTLLRAMSASAGVGANGNPKGTAPPIRAYVEAAPRVWVELGGRHPLAERIQPPPGEWLLLHAPRTWEALREQPFRDVYDTLEFRLPAASQPLVSATWDRKLPVSVRLQRGGADEPAELWVVSDRAVATLDRFVQSASDEVLQRLAFAVAGPTESPTVIVRIRPGRTAPPVVILDGLACRSYLRIPNLFVPVGQRLHPPLRRDAVQRMLAEDDARLTWVEPDGDGGFVPRSVADGAFLPLSDWVQYVLDRDHEKLDAWRRAHRFDFEDFVCSDDPPRQPKGQAKTERPVENPGYHPPPTNRPATRDPKSAFDPGTPRRPATKGTPDAAAAPPEEVVRLRERLAETERSFVELDAPLDAPERGPLWTEMAELHRALDRWVDASICRQHVLWDAPEPSDDDWSAWLETETGCAARQRVPVLTDGEGHVSREMLDRWLQARSPTSYEVAQLAAWTARQAATDADGDVVRERSGELDRYFREHERLLSVRACWLTWCALSVAAGDDVLRLARARDRLLERLHAHGPTAERDVPTFLRAGSAQSVERLRSFREKTSDLHGRVRKWSRANLHVASPTTLQYVDLIFAYGCARLGETDQARRLLQEAGEKLLDARDPVHGWLHDAYEFRIRAALDGHPLCGPLPDDLLGRLESLDRLARYKVDRLRQHSAILEPHERLDPYRNWRGRSQDVLERSLSALFDAADAEMLRARLLPLLATPASPADEGRILSAALEFAPRLGEDTAVEVLGRTLRTEAALDSPVLRAELLGKGLQVAAHFDQRDFVGGLLDRLERLLESQRTADLRTLEALEDLLVESLRGLRRLGLRDEIARLLDRFSDVVRKPEGDPADSPERLRIRLRLAAGWLWFGQDRGWADVDLARDQLLSGSVGEDGHVGAHRRTLLATAYVAAVGEAPLETALARWEELFDGLAGVHDATSVNTHYSQKQLDVVETLVLTIAGDDGALDKADRRWIHEEEYVLRRRIHRDVRKATGTH